MADENLESWVEEQLDQGYSLEQIEETAKSQGWTDEQIKEAEEIARQQKDQEKYPEEVSNSRDIARLRMRAAAYIVDIISIAILITVLGSIISLSIILVGLASGIMFLTGLGGLILFPIIILTFPLYFTVLEAKYGKTAGKKLLNLQVRTVNGKCIGWKHSIIRNLLRYVDENLALYTVGVIAILASEKSQRVGDMAAGTVVVRD